MKKIVFYVAILRTSQIAIIFLLNFFIAFFSEIEWLRKCRQDCSIVVHLIQDIFVLEIIVRFI
jgi:hypothetical protein